MKKLLNTFLSLILVFTIITPIQIEEVFATIDPNTLVINVPTSTCADGNYSVDRITGYNTFTQLACYTQNQFGEALSAMYAAAAQSPNVVVRNNISNSPLNIVAADRAIVYSQNNTYLNSLTMNLYDDKGLTDPYTYVSPENSFYYYGTEIKSKSSTDTITPSDLVTKVEINGALGYVPLNGVDIIPLIYVENRTNNWYITFTTRTVNINTGANVYTGNVIRPNITYYVVGTKAINTINGTVSKRVVTVHLDFALTAADYDIGVAPSWLSDGTYYSADGVHFYTDMDLKNPVMNGSTVGTYYNYYQYLSLRSKTQYTGANLDAYFTYFASINSTYLQKDIQTSVLKNQGVTFVNAQNTYGMNALLIYAMAIHESGFGLSTYATERYNLFGFNAYDSNPDSASYYASVADGVNQQMGLNLRNYLDYSNYSTSTNNSLFYASNIGSKGAGINTRYASDPWWSIKIAQWSFYIDRYLGFKDFDYYQIGILSDSSRTVYKNSQLTTTAYTVDARATDYPYLIHSSYNNTYYTYSTNPIADDGTIITGTTPGLVPYNWNNATVYIGSNQTTLANSAPSHINVISGTDDLLINVQGFEWDSTSQTVKVSGFAALKNTNMANVPVTHKLIAIDLNNSSNTYSFDLSILAGKTLNLGNGLDYANAWFTGSVNISNLPVGDYRFDILTAAGDTTGQASFFNSLLTAPLPELSTVTNTDTSSTSYLFRFNNKAKMRYELTKINGISDYNRSTVLPSQIPSISNLIAVNMTDNALSLKGFSFIVGTNFSTNETISHKLLLVDVSGNNYSYDLSVVAGQDLSIGNFNYSNAWFENTSIDLSTIPVGTYSIYIVSSNGSYTDLVRVYDSSYKGQLDFTSSTQNYSFKVNAELRNSYYLVVSALS